MAKSTTGRRIGQFAPKEETLSNYRKPEEFLNLDLNLNSWSMKEGPMGNYAVMEFTEVDTGENVTISTGAGAVMNALDIIEKGSIELPLICCFKKAGRRIYME